MEKGKKIDLINGEIQLPEAIIQHIQSFLSGKLAAQTSTLSKSWYSAWLTRPHLDFDQRYFQNRGESDLNFGDGFSEFTKKTMQRYEEMKLKIERLKLCMNITDWDNYSFANELTVKALKMRASDLDFEFLPQRSTFALPHVVLRSENLVRLSAIGCQIDRLADGKVSCSRLESLSLRGVLIESDLIRDIASNCPLIENLLLHDCGCLLVRNRMLTLGPSIEFQKLRCLSLEKLIIDSLFFHNLSSKFPCLKELTVNHCIGDRAIQICSASLECISIAEDEMLRAKFNVPSIRKFNFVGSCIPSPSFETTSREWKSDISIKCLNHLSTEWFRNLKLFLRMLSLSKISLSLDIGIFLESSFDYTGDVQGSSIPLVENLMLTMHAHSSVSIALLEGLFWSCRPKLITHYWLPKSCIGGKVNNEFLELLCKSLILEVSENCSIPNRLMFGLLDLEEVNVEIFEEDLAEWWLLHWKTLLDAAAIPEYTRKIRFHMRWGLEPITFR